MKHQSIIEIEISRYSSLGIDDDGKLRFSASENEF